MQTSLLAHTNFCKNQHSDYKQGHYLSLQILIESIYEAMTDSVFKYLFSVNRAHLTLMPYVLL